MAWEARAPVSNIPRAEGRTSLQATRSIRRRSHGGDGAGVRSRALRARSRPRAGPEPHLELGGYGLTGSGPRGQRPPRASRCPARSLLHAAAALGLVVVPLLSSDTMPEPQSGVRAFLVEPMSVPPPPPPPAARPAAAPRVSRSHSPSSRPSWRRSRSRPRSRRSRRSTSAATTRVRRTASRAACRAASWAASSAGCPRPRRRRRRPCASAAASASRAGVSAVPPVYPDLAAKARLQGIGGDRSHDQRARSRREREPAPGRAAASPTPRSRPSRSGSTRPRS